MGNSSPLIIKRSSEFLSLKQSGRRFWPTNWLLLNYSNNQLGQFRIGVTASRKVGPAVVRNKLKRWTREYFRKRLKADDTLSIDINLIFKPMGDSFYKDLTYDQFVRGLEAGVQVIRKNL